MQRERNHHYGVAACTYDSSGYCDAQYQNCHVCGTTVPESPGLANKWYDFRCNQEGSKYVWANNNRRQSQMPLMSINMFFSRFVKGQWWQKHTISTCGHLIVPCHWQTNFLGEPINMDDYGVRINASTTPIKFFRCMTTPINVMWMAAEVATMWDGYRCPLLLCWTIFLSLWTMKNKNMYGVQYSDKISLHVNACIDCENIVPTKWRQYLRCKFLFLLSFFIGVSSPCDSG